VSFNHHIGTSGRRSLQATALSVNMVEERISCVDAGAKPPDLIVRSHRHTYGMFQSSSAMAITTPAWQALTPHAKKVVPSSIAEVGGLILDWKRGDGKWPHVDRSHVSPAVVTTEVDE
jgi:hypothetical protein